MIEIVKSERELVVVKDGTYWFHTDLSSLVALRKEIDAYVRHNLPTNEG